MVQQRNLQELILVTRRLVQQESEQQFLETLVQLPQATVGIFQNQLWLEFCGRQQVQYWWRRICKPQDVRQ